MSNKRHPEHEEGSPLWMTTFADMMTLLFTFFVLLFSMSTLDPVKVSNMADAMNKMTGGKNENTERTPLDSQAQINKKLNTLIQEMNLKDIAEITADARGVAIELKGDITFSSGSVELHEKMLEILNNMIPKLLSNRSDLRPVIIEGHTDNQLPTGDLAKKYPTNWELSSARAAVVVNYLIQKGVPSGRLVASGYADRWPVDAKWQDIRGGVVNNDYVSEKNARQEQRIKNRRIKIIFTRG
jgi:chemotaxis protein MotB